MQTGTEVRVLHVLSTYRSKSEPELRVAGQDEPIPIVELPPALDQAEADRSQPSQSRALALEELLTPREAEIARFVAEGLSNKHIARPLGPAASASCPTPRAPNFPSIVDAALIIKAHGS